MHKLLGPAVDGNELCDLRQDVKDVLDGEGAVQRKEQNRLLNKEKFKNTESGLNIVFTCPCSRIIDNALHLLYNV